ncbi:MAG: hypothetical protein R3A43_02065 [Bacteroidia bacterium]
MRADSSGTALRYCEEQNIDAYIPNFGLYKPIEKVLNLIKTKINTRLKAGGNYNTNLKGIKTDSKGYQKKQYRSSESSCKNCLCENNVVAKAPSLKR